MRGKMLLPRYTIGLVTSLVMLVTCIPTALCGAAVDPANDVTDRSCPSYAQGQADQYGMDHVAERKIKFTMANHEALLLLPEQTSAADPIAWVWFAPMLLGQPNAHHAFIIQQVLNAGMAFASIDVGESYGSVDGTRLYAEFHDLLNRCFHLSWKAVLLPQSRGGLMLFNWASLHPDQVVRIAGIYPVCDLRSYPGLKVAAEAYGMTEQKLELQLKQHNPIDLLSTLAKADVPVLLIHGDNDKVVPLKQNSAEFVRRYQQLGGRARLIIVSGKGHEEVDEFFRSARFVKFLTTGR